MRCNPLLAGLEPARPDRKNYTMSLSLDSIISRERMKAVSKRVIYGGKKGEDLARDAGLMPNPIYEASSGSGSNPLFFMQGYHDEGDAVIIP